MKVTLDIDKLLREGRITPAEYARIMGSAAADTGSLALNILLGFGVVATAGGTQALLQSAPASIVLGALVAFGGVSLQSHSPSWVVNLVAVFGAIHFYTQYFERLGATPSSIVVAGLGAIGIAMVLVRYNRSDISPRPPSPATSS
jgi:hypothetical protein